MTRRVFGASFIGIVLATAIGWLQTAAQPAGQSRITALLPTGASLVLQAKDFASIVNDWNASAEKTKWLGSANYRAFLRSRLLLRLNDASDEFAAAAGIPPGMALLSDVAGAESALALYDIGKLEFLYVTRLPAARAVENALWRTRGNYEPREAAGTPFYVRSDARSKRIVAFAARDQYLLLATREDLLAGALKLIAGQGGSSVEADGWFATSVKAAGPPGDVRLVLDVGALAKQPHFRSYWIHGNVTELRQFASGVSDLFRAPAEIREERVFVRVEEKPARESAALGDIARLAPDAAGLYRAWIAPAADEAANLIFEKAIATTAASGLRQRTAPRIGPVVTVTGSEGDLETRIDEEARAPRASLYEMAALRQLVGSEPLTAMLHLEATRPAADGRFVDRGSVIVLARATEWPQGAMRDAVRSLIDPVWTKAHLGMRWIEVGAGARAFSQLEGMESVAVAERGTLLFIANDPALLVSALDRVSSPAVPMQGSYAAGFRHALERDRFASMMRFIDHAAAGMEGREPLFFSENVASLSETLSRVEAVTSVLRDRGANVSQTVVYRLAR